MSRPEPAATPRRDLARLVPWIAVVLALTYLIASARRPAAPLAVTRFAATPVSYKGRVKPIDTVARNTLLILSGRQTLRLTGGDGGSAGPAAPEADGPRDRPRRLMAIEWLLDVLAHPREAESHPVFRVDHPDVRALLGHAGSDRKYYSIALIRDRAQALMDQARAANRVPGRDRSAFQQKTLELASHLNLYDGLSSYRDLFVQPPPSPEHDWMTLTQSSAYRKQTGTALDGERAWLQMLQAHHDGRQAEFARAIASYHGWLGEHMPAVSTRARFETLFNRVEPFYRTIVLYVIVALLVFAVWLKPARPVMAAAWWLLILGLTVHTLGLAARVYLSGRPPVTNLYSSAVFIGWGCAGLCVVLERLFRNGIAMMLAAASGCLTLLVARALAGDGDTMAVLQAVLDTNFWLATHVVVITLGYSATFLAGLLGVVFIARGLFTQALTRSEARAMDQMVYGIICFALLFSFVGTVLGGIWADQSWGRFWGWDPKENGALLIVLWNALILHARWGGMIRARGMAVLATFGNIVTAWSWFGTNMLGVGLHAYGFIDSAVFWLALFIASHLLLIGLGVLPRRHWRSEAVW